MLSAYEKGDTGLLIREFGKETQLSIIEKAKEIRQISYWKNQENPENLDTCLKLMFVDLAGSFSINHNLKPNQIDEIVEIIKEEYWFARLEDFYLICKMIKRGEIPLQFNRLDVAFVSSVIKKYFSDQSEKIIEVRDREHHENKSKTPDGPRSNVDKNKHAEALGRYLTETEIQRQSQEKEEK